VFPGTWRRQRVAACKTKLFEVRSLRAKAQANKLGQFHPSVPLFTNRITRWGAPCLFRALKASISACFVSSVSEVFTRQIPCSRRKVYTSTLRMPSFRSRASIHHDPSKTVFPTTAFNRRNS